MTAYASEKKILVISPLSARRESQAYSIVLKAVFLAQVVGLAGFPLSDAQMGVGASGLEEVDVDLLFGHHVELGLRTCAFDKFDSLAP